MGYVSTSSGQFIKDGRRFRPIGVNNYPLIQSNYTDAQLDEFFAYCVRDGITVVRTWAYNKTGPATNSAGYFQYLVSTTITYREATYVQMDRVLAKAKIWGIKIILVLSDNYPEFNNWGFKQERAYWNNVINGTSYDRYNNGDAFIFAAACVAAFKVDIDAITDRVNTINGIAYNADDTIFSYECMNEARMTTGTDTNQNTLSSYRIGVLTDWYDEISTYIKSKDSNHLVGTGSVTQFYNWYSNDPIHNGSYYGQDFSSQCDLANIDYFDYHMYLYNGTNPGAMRAIGQYALTDGGSTTPSLAGLVAQLQEYADIAHTATKPIIIGEWGIDKRTTITTPFPAYPRSTHFQQLFDLIFSSDMDYDGIFLWHYTHLFDDNNFNIKPSGIHTGGYANGNANDDDSGLLIVMREMSESLIATNLVASQIAFYRSSNTDSDGGTISTTRIDDATLNNVFPDVTPDEALAGASTYRKIFVKNLNGAINWQNASFWRGQATDSEDDEISIGIGTSADLDGSSELTAFTADAYVVLSSDGADTRVVTLVGEDNAGTRLTETVTLTGSTPVSSANIYHKLYLASVASVSASRIVTVKQGSGGTTRGTIGLNKYSAITYFSPTTKETGIKVGTINHGASQAIWLKRTVSAEASQYSANRMILSAEGEST